MQLKRVTLENIRSYLQGEVEFPEGSTLLSGNIGSGKTTILLAVEFALFGLMKGSLSGSALLRNGADKGSVEIAFALDKNEVKIGRNLKRTPSSVVQEAGYIEIDGIRKEATAIELKQKVLELLNYPKDLLTKNKALLYRYTVYTPQEEMKFILQCDHEERLEILRKVFGIDKYKRIADNTKILIQHVKEGKKEISGFIADLPQLQALEREKQSALQTVESIIQEATQQYALAKEKEDQVAKELPLLEGQLQATQEMKKNIEVTTFQLSTNKKRLLLLQQESSALQQNMQTLQLETSGCTEASVRQLLLQEKENLAKREKELHNILLQLHENKIKKESAEHLVHKITALNNCPTCLQDVRHEHKSTIITNEHDKIFLLEKQTQDLAEQQKALQHSLTGLRLNIERLMQEEAKAELLKHKLQALQEKQARQSAMQKEMVSLQKEIVGLELRQSSLQGQLKDTSILEDLFIRKKQEHQELQKNEKTAYLKKAELELKRRHLQEEILIYKARIQEKEEKRKKMEYHQKLQFWLEENFMQMMQTMEKSIMLKVHQDFSGLFEKWFSMLVDKDVLTVKLDDAFNPKIEQNGYDIDFEFLSGGEKTAAALAYRLALNQVINNLMGVVATKDLIILDEPTDGFSSEQLDRLRNILEEINIKQVIIVSHEPKIESFVSSVIKFEKKEHITSILA